MAEFQAKNTPQQPARGLPCNGVNTKMLPIAFFGLKSIFCGQPQKIVTIIMGHLKDNLFVLTALQGPSPFLAQNLIFFTLHWYIINILYKLTHLRQTLSSWKLCYRLFFARRPKHEIDLIFRQVNFQLGKLLENFEKKMSAKHFGCNKPWGEYRRLQDSPRSSYEFNLKALRP